MRIRLLLVLGGLVGGVLAACSSGGGSPSAAVDAGTGGAGLGETCNPSAPKPCVVVTDVCSVAVCDPASHLCVRVSVDAGPTCGGNPSPTCASGECDGSADDATTEAGDAAGGDGSGEAGEAGAGGDSSIDDGGASDASDAGDAGGG